MLLSPTLLQLINRLHLSSKQACLPANLVLALLSTHTTHTQPPFYDAGAIKHAVHTLFRPIKAAAWALFGAIFKLQTSTPCECALLQTG